MDNTKFMMALKEQMMYEYSNDLSNTEEHKFSANFERKMDKLIKHQKKPYFRMTNTVGKRIVCITVIIIITLMSTVMSVDAFREAFKNFFLQMFEKNSIVQSTDHEGALEIIEEIYDITYDMSKYERVIYKNTSTKMYVNYTLKSNYINLRQIVKSEFNYSINTESAEISYIDINGYEAMCWRDLQNYYNLIWENEDYCFMLDGNIGKNELIEMAKSIRKK